jgi:membrane protein
LTVVVALWSAGKGVLALTTGLNCVYGCNETRNYLILRLRATIYTVIFIAVIIFLLVLSVFGNSLNIFIGEHVPILERVANKLIETRVIVMPLVMIAFSLIIYKFLPNNKTKMLHQLPGAVFATLGWMVVSWIFSVYVDIFTGFSSMYGSLTTIVLIMLWMYFCMYSTLIGGEVNVWMEEKLFRKEKTTD